MYLLLNFTILKDKTVLIYALLIIAKKICSKCYLCRLSFTGGVDNGISALGDATEPFGNNNGGVGNFHNQGTVNQNIIGAHKMIIVQSNYLYIRLFYCSLFSYRS